MSKPPFSTSGAARLENIMHKNGELDRVQQDDEMMTDQHFPIFPPESMSKPREMSIVSGYDVFCKNLKLRTGKYLSGRFLPRNL